MRVVRFGGKGIRLCLGVQSITEFAQLLLYSRLKPLSLRASECLQVGDAEVSIPHTEPGVHRLSPFAHPTPPTADTKEMVARLIGREDWSGCWDKGGLLGYRSGREELFTEFSRCSINAR